MQSKIVALVLQEQEALGIEILSLQIVNKYDGVDSGCQRYH